jgi:hypothetical protein
VSRPSPFTLMLAVRDRSRAKGTARAVLMTLASYADPDGRRVFPSTTTIADKTGIARSTAIKALHELELANEIERVGRRGVGRYGVIEYRITLPETDRPAQRRTDEPVRGSDRKGAKAGGATGPGIGPEGADAEGGSTGPGIGPEGADAAGGEADRGSVRSGRAEEREG